MSKAYLVTYNRKHDILCDEPIVQYYDNTRVKVLGDISVIVNGKPVYIKEDQLIGRQDYGYNAGQDYAICLKEDGTIIYRRYGGTDTAAIPITERVIGGFHCSCRKVSPILNKAPTSAFGQTVHELAYIDEYSILPKSVWALNFRPSCDDPTGMVYSKECDMWIDIYNGSGTIDAPQSKFGGIRLHSHTATEFLTGYANVGKQLLTDEIFWFASVGSNCGTKVAGEAQPNPDTTGGHNDTNGYPMVSSIGCEECCGLQGQFLRDFSVTASGSWDLESYPTKAFAGGDNDFGSHFNMVGFRCINAGGYWGTGNVKACGPLCRDGAVTRSDASAQIRFGGRGCCKNTRHYVAPNIQPKSLNLQFNSSTDVTKDSSPYNGSITNLGSSAFAADQADTTARPDARTMTRKGSVSFAKGNTITGSFGSGAPIPNLSSSTGGWTIAFWLKMDPAMLDESVGFLTYKFSNIYTIPGLSTETVAVLKALVDCATAGQWCHLCFQFNPQASSSYYKIFVNQGYTTTTACAAAAFDSQGSTRGDNPWIMPFSINGNTFSIGGNFGASATYMGMKLSAQVPVYGYYDDFTVINKAISAHEISKLSSNWDT